MSLAQVKIIHIHKWRCAEKKGTQAYTHTCTSYKRVEIIVCAILIICFSFVVAVVVGGIGGIGGGGNLFFFFFLAQLLYSSSAFAPHKNKCEGNNYARQPYERAKKNEKRKINNKNNVQTHQHATNYN